MGKIDVPLTLAECKSDCNADFVIEMGTCAGTSSKCCFSSQTQALFPLSALTGNIPALPVNFPALPGLPQRRPSDGNLPTLPVNIPVLPGLPQRRPTDAN